MHRLFQANH